MDERPLFGAGSKVSKHTKNQVAFLRPAPTTDGRLHVQTEAPAVPAPVIPSTPINGTKAMRQSRSQCVPAAPGQVPLQPQLQSKVQPQIQAPAPAPVQQQVHNPVQQVAQPMVQTSVPQAAPIPQTVPPQSPVPPQPVSPQPLVSPQLQQTPVLTAPTQTVPAQAVPTQAVPNAAPVAPVPTTPVANPQPMQNQVVPGQVSVAQPLQPQMPPQPQTQVQAQQPIFGSPSPQDPQIAVPPQKYALEEPEGSEEDRKDTRKRALKGGMVIIPGQMMSSYACKIRNESRGGVMLVLTDSMLIPPEFYLIRDADPSNRIPCRVAWRGIGRVGVQFLTQLSNP